MAVRQLSKSTIAQGLPRGSKFWDQVSSESSFDSIATVTVGAGGQSTITFSSIPQTYTHLQIRGLNIFTGSVSYGYISFNSDSSSGNYSGHYLAGSGTGIGSTAFTSQNKGFFTSAGGTSPSAPNTFVMDILDYTNTNKYKTLKTLYGWDANGTGYIEFNSSNWRSTSAITSIELSTSGNSFTSGTSVALYGIKAV